MRRTAFTICILVVFALTAQALDARDVLALLNAGARDEVLIDAITKTSSKPTETINSISRCEKSTVGSKGGSKVTVALTMMSIGRIRGRYEKALDGAFSLCYY